MLGSSSSSIAAVTNAAMSPPPTPKHDVFLSFRGEDTRYNFISHLYAELCRKNIKTFIDYELVRGEEISPALSKAIEESKIYVVVLSEHYASSTWCLDELTKILECKHRYGRDVIPVFYKVLPSNVRHHRQSFAEAFDTHQHRFKDKVDAWKVALTQVAALSGWHSQVTRPEHTLVTDLVKDILRKLSRSSYLSDYQGLVGIEKHIEKIQSMLHLESPAVRIIGIWGMGGIGKTTIARVIYRKLATKFNSSCIVLNVQQEIERSGGGHHVRDKFVSQLLEQDNASYGNINQYYNIQRLEQKKALLVLDDVNDSDQLINLIVRQIKFGQGSRIIVTSRDMQVLNNGYVDAIYQVQEMSFQDSLQLFCLNAFKQNHPIETHVGLLEKVLNYAKGVPLTLEVLGLFLQGRPREAWESELQKLERLPDLKTFGVLKLSYDGLDDEQKDIFLDIACFYRGHLENAVAQTLDYCGFSTRIGMEVLKDRCLISISEGRIVMHDLIQEMGHEIVRQQCVNDPGKRSRLWKPQDIYNVLRKNKGTDIIQCIFLDICKIRKVQLHPETFEKMHNLRMIQFYSPSSSFWQGSNVTLPAFLKSLPDDLKFLRWDGFPHRSFPLNFCPENLVKLDMPHSHLEQLWEGNQALPNLKRINLSYSHKLIRLPDLCLSPSIEEIILTHCINLVQVHSSSFINNLNYLCLHGCVKLRSLYLPSNILSGSSGSVLLYGCYMLETFLISNRIEVVQPYEVMETSRVNIRRAACNVKCCMIREYPPDTFDPIVSTADKYEKEEPVDNIRSLLLNIEERVQTMPSLFTSINELCSLDITDCESLTSLPTEIFKLKLLTRFYLGGCSNLEKLPEIEETMENLMLLVLDETAIKELPSSLDRLVGLEELSLQMCLSLVIIPSSIGNLSKLCKLNLTCCESLETFPSSIFKLKLTKLNLHGCSMLKTFPEVLEPSETFVHINLTKTAIKELPSSLENLVGVRNLCLKLCSDIMSLPNSIVNLKHLSHLDCSGCTSLTKIPKNIGCLSSLKELSLQESGIVNLPESIAHLSSLTSLDLSDCKRLECIPPLPPYINQLLTFDCPSIKRVMSNSTRLNLNLPLDSNETSTFKFHFTNSQELDASAHSNIATEAWLRITEVAYRSVFFCFPGNAIPRWFPYRCQGHSVTAKKASLDWCSGNNRLGGFALCVVLGHMDMDVDDDAIPMRCSLTYRLTFEFDGRTHILPIPSHDMIKNYFYWKGERNAVQNHTFIWKYQLDFQSINDNNMLFHADNFTFKLNKYNHRSDVVKGCGICPLYIKEKDHTGVNFLDNVIEEPSGRNAS